ncbi:MAG: hypothetical protein ACREEB_15985 [Caulobacteraceae bacterium]
MSDNEEPPEPRRRDRFMEQLFTVGNLAIFLALLVCVAIAAVLWELWH